MKEPYKKLEIVATVKAVTAKGKPVVRKYKLFCQSKKGQMVFRLGPPLRKLRG